jgi:formylglycine-generating enzyme required for sulfatase activity
MLMRRMLAGLAVACSMALVPGVQAQCSGDVNGDGLVDAIDLATVLGQWGTCPATISSVSPSHGSVLGGTVITITGTSLAATSTVTVGGVPCTDLTVLSPTQVRATTPAGAAGEAAIAVTTPAGTSLSPSSFTYLMQSVTSLVPSSGIYSGGTAITISGAFLGGVTSVTIGGVPCTSVVAVSSTTVTAVTPAGSVGAVDVVVTGVKGAVTVPGGFTYLNFVVPSWATLIEAMPDPAVVTDEGLRNAIIATGLAWRVRDNASQIEMLLVPPGTFDRGCSASNFYSCAADESPVRAVSITNAFYIGRFEVRQSEWQHVMGSNPSSYVGLNLPVNMVSWGSTQFFSAATGLRLPTEAEWEYAYRAGTTTAFHSFSGYPNGTNDDVQLGAIARYSPTPFVIDGPGPVGQKQANGFGLHDMSGNVWELVNDWYSQNYYNEWYPVYPFPNPSGPTSGTSRVMRGGSWYLPSGLCRSSARGAVVPNQTYVNMYGGDLGFRAARNP